MILRLCMVFVFSGSVLFSQISKNDKGCEGFFSELYELTHGGEVVFDVNDSIRVVEVGMKTFLFNVKFHYTDRCNFLNKEKAFKDINSLVNYLQKNGEVIVQLVIYNWWLTPESSDLLNCQIEKIGTLLREKGIPENRFEIIISRDGYKMFPSNDSLLDDVKCDGGLPPITYLNSWLDVVVVKT